MSGRIREPCLLQGILHPGPPAGSFGDLGVPATPRPVHRPAQGTSSFWLSLSSSTHSPASLARCSGSQGQLTIVTQCLSSTQLPPCHPLSSLSLSAGPSILSSALSVKWLFLEPCWASNSGTGTGQKRFLVHSQFLRTLQGVCEKAPATNTIMSHLLVHTEWATSSVRFDGSGWIPVEVWNRRCRKEARQACGYHPGQVSLPLPSKTNPRSLIRGTHAGAIHLSSPAEDTLSNSQGEVTGSRVQKPLLQPWAVQASAQLQEYSEKTLKLTEGISPGTSPKKCLRGHCV